MACVKNTLSSEKLPGLEQGKADKIFIFSIHIVEANLHIAERFDFLDRRRCMKEQGRVVRDEAKKSPYVFQSGDIAVVSGLYRPDHSKCHTSPAMRIGKGERFPLCPQCNEPAN